MRVHIVGCGPTGMALAWEIIHGTDHEVILYDKKSGPGGSWWEPSTEERDLHSHRIVFQNAYVNTRSLFDEMAMAWSDIFEPSTISMYGALLPKLSFVDYVSLTSLATRVLANPEYYKTMSLKEAVGRLSRGGRDVLQHTPMIMDGVPWTKMTAYEYVKSFDVIALSRQYTQKVSGKVMSDQMRSALEVAGAKFVFDAELDKVTYGENEYLATFKGDGVQPVKDGMMILAVDHAQAKRLVGDNWGPNAVAKLDSGLYEAMNVLVDFDGEAPDVSFFEAVMDTRWNIIPARLADKKTLSCVITELTSEVLRSPPETIKREVVKQLGLTGVRDVRIAWGSHWDEAKGWSFTQSSGAYGLLGQVPFWGECPHVALVGMMSPRDTPFASIESAVEVARKFCHEEFGTRAPLRPFLLTHALVVLVVLLVVVFAV